MGSRTNQSPINELIGLLHRYDPTRLQQLQAAFPESVVQLSPGLLAGDLPPVPGDAATWARIAVCRDGLSLAVTVGQTALRSVLRRLQRSNRVQLGAELVVLVACMISYAALAGGTASTIDQASGAILSLALGSFVLAHRLHRSSLGNTSCWSLYRDLGSANSHATTLLGHLRLWEEGQLSGAEADVLVQDANLLAARLAELAAEEGILSLDAESPTSSQLELLRALLLDLFRTPEMLRMWIRFAPGGEEITHNLPDLAHLGSVPDPQMRMHYIGAAVELMRAFGFIDEAFFRRLVAHFPRRARDIQRAQARWNTRLAV